MGRSDPPQLCADRPHPAADRARHRRHRPRPVVVLVRGDRRTAHPGSGGGAGRRMSSAGPICPIRRSRRSSRRCLPGWSASGIRCRTNRTPTGSSGRTCSGGWACWPTPGWSTTCWSPRANCLAAQTAVRAVPRLSFVLDHAAKPAVAAGDWQPWADAVTALAGLPNVSCKLSGLVTEAHWDAWRPQQILPYARHVLEAFGPGRVMFGSDWPVCTLAMRLRGRRGARGVGHRPPRGGGTVGCLRGNGRAGVRSRGPVATGYPARRCGVRIPPASDRAAAEDRVIPRRTPAQRCTSGGIRPTAYDCGRLRMTTDDSTQR